MSTDESQIGSIDVYFNASALIGPKTGVGQYCHQLMLGMRKRTDIRSHYFYRWNWSGELLLDPYGLNAQKSKSMVRQLAEKVPALSYGVHHALRSLVFQAGLPKASRAAVYHEPNFVALQSNLPMVVTVHDLSILHYPHTHPRYRVAVMQDRIGKSAIRADCVITPSEYIRQEVIAEFGLPEDRVVAVPEAAAEIFVPVAAEVVDARLAQHGLRAGGYVLAVGTLEPRKNLDTAIQAYARLPEAIRSEIPFIIVGMRGWKLEEFDRSIAAMINKAQIRQLGYVPDDMLPALYSGARAFVYPSLYEGFGLPPIEAMACGAPVIVSRSSSLPEVVGDAGIQVAALDVDALGEAMGRLIEDDALRLSLGKKGIQRAAGFSWQKCAEQTVAVYRRVLS